LTISQLAVYLDMPRRRLYRLIARHPSFPVFKKGNHWCAEVGPVIDWLLDDFEREKAELLEKDRRRKSGQTHENSNEQVFTQERPIKTRVTCRT
jgi:hypothetical protein